MESLWLVHWKSNEEVPYSCSSCLKWEPNGSTYWMIRCDKWTLMRPNDYCYDFSLDDTMTMSDVINIVKEYICINSKKIELGWKK